MSHNVLIVVPCPNCGYNTGKDNKILYDSMFLICHNCGYGWYYKTPNFDLQHNNATKVSNSDVANRKKNNVNQEVKTNNINKTSSSHNYSQVNNNASNYKNLKTAKNHQPQRNSSDYQQNHTTYIGEVKSNIKEHKVSNMARRNNSNEVTAFNVRESNNQATNNQGDSSKPLVRQQSATPSTSKKLNQTDQNSRITIHIEQPHLRHQSNEVQQSEPKQREAKQPLTTADYQDNTEVQTRAQPAAVQTTTRGITRDYTAKHNNYEAKSQTDNIQHVAINEAKNLISHNRVSNNTRNYASSNLNQATTEARDLNTKGVESNAKEISAKADYQQNASNTNNGNYNQSHNYIPKHDYVSKNSIMPSQELRESRTLKQTKVNNKVIDEAVANQALTEVFKTDNNLRNDGLLKRKVNPANLNTLQNAVNTEANSNTLNHNIPKPLAIKPTANLSINAGVRFNQTDEPVVTDKNYQNLDDNNLDDNNFVNNHSSESHANISHTSMQVTTHQPNVQTNSTLTADNTKNSSNNHIEEYNELDFLASEHNKYFNFTDSPKRGMKKTIQEAFNNFKFVFSASIKEHSYNFVSSLKHPDVLLKYGALLIVIMAAIGSIFYGVHYRNLHKKPIYESQINNAAPTKNLANGELYDVKNPQNLDVNSVSPIGSKNTVVKGEVNIAKDPEKNRIIAYEKNQGINNPKPNIYSIPTKLSTTQTVTSWWRTLVMQSKVWKANFNSSIKVDQTTGSWQTFNNDNTFLINTTLINKDDNNSYLISSLEIVFINLQGNVVARRAILTNQILNNLSKVNLQSKMKDIPFDAAKAYVFVKSAEKLN